MLLHGKIYIKNPYLKGRKFANLICKPCKEDCDIELYRINVVNAISYFLKAVINKDASYLYVIENPSLTPLFDPFIKITAEKKYQGYDVLQTGPFCKHL
jgi:hypothetical protein